MKTRTFKIHGRDGHRIKASFGASCSFTLSNGDSISSLCSDLINTNDYVLIQITSSTDSACIHHLCDQLSDGILESSKCGKIELLIPDDYGYLTAHSLSFCDDCMSGKSYYYFDGDNEQLFEY